MLYNGSSSVWIAIKNKIKILPPSPIPEETSDDKQDLVIILMWPNIYDLIVVTSTWRHPILMQKQGNLT